jgi:probable rRNA maturation factor
MLDVAVIEGMPWPRPDGGDWEALLARASEAAVAATPHTLLIGSDATVEIAIRLTDDAEVRGLNAQWRGKDKPTNVLSFPSVQPDLLVTLSNSDDGEVLLGDIVLARETCVAEAADKGIAVRDHAMHLVVHGTLHLLGYDHIDDAQAERMEALERDILSGLGISDPYAVIEDS